jgi:hypothetical protein
MKINEQINGGFSMSKQSVKKEADLDGIRIELDDFLAEWSETLDEFAAAKQETSFDNLFETLEYLTYCDELCKAIFLDKLKIDSQFKHLEELKEKESDNKNRLKIMDESLVGFQELRNSMQEKLESIVEEYYTLSENTLRHTQDTIQKFTETMKNEKITPNLKTEINQNLEQELYLQELKDILENYREAREDLISEILVVSPQEFPEGLIPEDLGEENPKFDPIMSELDSAITACDEALIIKEIQD